MGFFFAAPAGPPFGAAAAGAELGDEGGLEGELGDEGGLEGELGADDSSDDSSLEDSLGSELGGGFFAVAMVWSPFASVQNHT